MNHGCCKNDIAMIPISTVKEIKQSTKEYIYALFENIIYI